MLIVSLGNKATYLPFMENTFFCDTSDYYGRSTSYGINSFFTANNRLLGEVSAFYDTYPSSIAQFVFPNNQSPSMSRIRLLWYKSTFYDTFLLLNKKICLLQNKLCLLRTYLPHMVHIHPLRPIRTFYDKICFYGTLSPSNSTK